MDYKALIKESTKHLIEFSGTNSLLLFPPASKESIDKVEQLIGRSLPEELIELYQQTDGANDEWFCFNIMNSDELLRQNKSIRIDELLSDFPGRDELLVFSHLDGNMIYYRIADNGYDGIYEWNCITNERTYIAHSLREWICKENA